VAGIVEGRSATPAEIGRHIPTEAFEKHKIKQVDRFLGNESFDPMGVSRGLISLLNLDPLVTYEVAIDWTKTGRFETLTSSIVMGGRSLPFQWTCIDKDVTRMALTERQHVKRLKQLLPENVRCVLLFDAGFDDKSFIKFLDTDVKMNFVVRSSPQVCVRRINKSKHVHLMKCRWKRGRVYDWGEVDFAKTAPTRIRLVVIHDHGMADPWILLTNLNAPAETIVKLYSRRFETEETYKDLKDIRSGLQLKDTRVNSIEHLERLLAACAAAYFIMILAGLYGEDQGLHHRLQANSVKTRRVIAVWRVGRALLRKGLIAGQDLLTRLWRILAKISMQLGGQSICPASS